MPWIPDPIARYWIPQALLLEVEFWILVVSRIQDPGAVS